MVLLPWQERPSSELACGPARHQYSLRSAPAAPRPAERPEEPHRRPRRLPLPSPSRVPCKRLLHPRPTQRHRLGAADIHGCGTAAHCGCFATRHPQAQARLLRPPLAPEMPPPRSCRRRKGQHNGGGALMLVDKAPGQCACLCECVTTARDDSLEPTSQTHTHNRTQRRDISTAAPHDRLPDPAPPNHTHHMPCVSPQDLTLPLPPHLPRHASPQTRPSTCNRPHLTMVHSNTIPIHPNATTEQPPHPAPSQTRMRPALQPSPGDVGPCCM